MRALRIELGLTSDIAADVGSSQVRAYRAFRLILHALLHLTASILKLMVAHYNGLTPLKGVELFDAVNRLIEQSVSGRRDRRRLLIISLRLLQMVYPAS